MVISFSSTQLKENAIERKEIIEKSYLFRYKIFTSIFLAKTLSKSALSVLEICLLEFLKNLKVRNKNNFFF